MVYVAEDHHKGSVMLDTAVVAYIVGTTSYI